MIFSMFSCPQLMTNSSPQLLAAPVMNEVRRDTLITFPSMRKGIYLKTAHRMRGLSFAEVIRGEALDHPRTLNHLK